MLIRNPITHYVDEFPDLMRNPFVNPTRIDCDKEFISDGVDYNDALKTNNRPNVSEEVLALIEEQLITPVQIDINVSELIRLNAPNVTKR